MDGLRMKPVGSRSPEVRPINDVMQAHLVVMGTAQTSGGGFLDGS